MGKQTSIPCDSEVRDRLANDKPDNMSWSVFLSTLHSDGEIPVDETPDPAYDFDADDLQEAFGLPDAAIPDDLDERLRRIESAASTAEERTGSIENTLENMGGR